MWAANEFQNGRCRFKQTAHQWRDKATGGRWWIKRVNDFFEFNGFLAVHSLGDGGNDSTLQRFFQHKRRIKREAKLAA